MKVSLKQLKVGLLTGMVLITTCKAQSYEVQDNVGNVAPKTVHFSDIERDFFPNLQSIAPKPGGEGYHEKLKAVKSKRGAKQYRFKTSATALGKGQAKRPVALNTFRGNKSRGIPNDNDIAISSMGKIVSVTNSRISIFDTAGQRLDKHSLEAFADTLNIQGNKYDPRIAYDQDNDRFVIAFLNGRLDSTSRIIMGFSKTQDPLKGWHLYALPGDPLSDTSWSDFPAMALTKDEVFLTVNLLYNDSSWQKGFKQSIIWQIDKQKAYQGDTLETRLYSDINYKGDPIRNFTPVRGGREPKGPGIYLLSNRNFAEKTDTFFLLQVTGKQNDPSTNLTVDLVKADSEYGAPPNANQPRSKTLATNDARILSTFIVNDRIHFAGNTVNFSNNLATIYHGQITSPNSDDPSIALNVIDHPYLELGYPSMAFAGQTKQDNEVMLFTDHTSDTINPGYSAIYFKEGAYSSLNMLKKGKSHVNVLGGKAQRWGDYSGIQRSLNDKTIFWAAGYFGIELSITERINATGITKIGTESVSGIKGGHTNPVSVSTNPNPAKQKVHVNFNLDKHRYLEFTLMNANGQKVKSLQKRLVEPGKHRFKISVNNLSDGTYFLAIRNQRKQITTKKVIKQ